MDFQGEPMYARQLWALRWKDWSCGKCGHTACHQLKSRPRVFQCARCGAQMSVTAGTLLHGTRLPLKCWFIAAERFSSRRSISARMLARELSVSVHTSWRMLQRFRSALAEEEEPLLQGMVQVAARGFRCRQPLVGTKRWVSGVFVVDEQGRWRYWQGLKPNVLIPRLLQVFPVKLAPVGQPGPNAAESRVHAMYRVIWSTHRQVSELWLRRYARGCAFIWENDLVKDRVRVARSLLERCMQSGPAPFWSLRPFQLDALVGTPPWRVSDSRVSPARWIGSSNSTTGGRASGQPTQAIPRLAPQRW